MPAPVQRSCQLELVRIRIVPSPPGVEPPNYLLYQYICPCGRHRAYLPINNHPAVMFPERYVQPQPAGRVAPMQRQRLGDLRPPPGFEPIHHRRYSNAMDLLHVNKSLLHEDSDGEVVDR